MKIKVFEKSIKNKSRKKVIKNFFIRKNFMRKNLTIQQIYGILYMSKKENMKRLNLVVDDYLFGKITEYARSNHLLVSEVVRDILRKVIPELKQKSKVKIKKKKNKKEEK